MPQSPQDLKKNVEIVLSFVKEVLESCRTNANAEKIDRQLTELEEEGSAPDFIEDLPGFVSVRAYKQDGRMCVELSVDSADPIFKEYIAEKL